MDGMNQVLKSNSMLSPIKPPADRALSNRSGNSHQESMNSSRRQTVANPQTKILLKGEAMRRV